MPEEIPLQHLNVFLIKDGLDDYQIIKDREHRIYQLFEIGNHTYHVYGKHRHDHLPNWIPFFENYLRKDMFWKSDSPGVVLLLTVENQRYALAFGQGRHMLYPDCFEDQFGLKTVINSVKSVKSLEKLSFDKISGHSVTQAAQEAEVGLFDFDVEKDLLRAVTGSLKDSKLGERLSGVDSLATATRTTLEDLPNLLTSYLAQSKLNTYIENGFGFVDHMKSVGAGKLKDDLNALLLEQLKEVALQLKKNLDKPSNFELIIPDIVDFSLTTKFNYTESFKSLTPRQDINLKSFLLYKTQRNPLTPETLKSSVYGFSADGRKTHTWQTFKCLVGEMDLNNERYILSDGNWYKVRKEYAEELDYYVENVIPKYQIDFPKYAGGDERHYNNSVAENVPGFFCFDGKIVHPAKGSKFEFCDLYTENYGYRDAVHVKHGLSSAVLSHLFSQGTTSSELFNNYPQSRKEIEEMVAAKFRKIKVPAPNGNLRLRTVFAVIRPKKGKLPFFSKVNLRRACRDLTITQQPHALAEITYDQEYLVLKG